MKKGKKIDKSPLGTIIDERMTECEIKTYVDLAKRLTTSPVGGEVACQNYMTELNTARRKIQRWLEGTSAPTMYDLKDLCNVLDCDPQYLWGTSPVARKATATASEYTGLFADHVEMLANENSNSTAFDNLYYNGTVLDGLNLLLQSEHFREALRAFAKSYALMLVAACNEALLSANFATGKVLTWSPQDIEKDIKESKLYKTDAFIEFATTLAELSSHAKEKGKTLDWHELTSGKISIDSYLKINSTENK